MKAEWSNKDSLEMPTTTMNEYIKREDAIKEANTWSMFGNDNLESRLKRLPSADVVEVVRCKNCIHNGSIDTDCPFGWKDKKFNMPNPNDYCAWGEEQEHDGRRV